MRLDAFQQKLILWLIVDHSSINGIVNDKAVRGIHRKIPISKQD